MTTSDFLVGLDLGQASDYTAWIIVERTEREDDRVSCYDVRHIDRTRGAPYPQIVEHSRALIGALRGREPRPDVTLTVDYTGVGRPVADMLVDAKLAAALKLVTITGGDSETSGERGERRVPKRNLAGVVQVLLQGGRLRIGKDLPLAGVLTTELVNFRVKISLAGHDSYGVAEEWREGQNDDLVLALALALWQGERTPRPLLVALPVIIGETLFSASDYGVRLGDGDDPWEASAYVTGEPWA